MFALPVSWTTRDVFRVEEKFPKFSGEPRDARENLSIRVVFGRISVKIDVKTQNRAMPKFQNLVLTSKFGSVI